VGALRRNLDPVDLVKSRFHQVRGGIDLGFGVLTVPAGDAARLLDEVLPAEAHYDAVALEDDPDLTTT